MNNQQITPEMVEQIISEMPDEQRKWFEGLTVDSLEELKKLRDQDLQKLKDWRKDKEAIRDEIEEFWTSMEKPVNLGNRTHFTLKEVFVYYRKVSEHEREAYKIMKSLWRTELTAYNNRIDDTIREIKQGYEFIYQELQEVENAKAD